MGIGYRYLEPTLKSIVFTSMFLLENKIKHFVREFRLWCRQRYLYDSLR